MADTAKDSEAETNAAALDDDVEELDSSELDGSGDPLDFTVAAAPRSLDPSATGRARDSGSGEAEPAAPWKAPSSDPAPAPRYLLAGKYQLEKEIGRGAMGRVYSATQIGLKRKVAVKLMSANQSGDFRRRFLLEASALAGLSHRNIVTIYDAGEGSNDVLFIAMELLEGRPVLKALESGPFSVARSLHLASQVARGLRAAHKAGFIHRDLKPNNIFLVPDDEEGEVAKILDFGVVKQVTGGGEQTREGLILGTPAYMAPEQITSSSPVDARSDIYSLGCVLYHVLSGRPPFVAGSEFDLLTAQIKTPATPIPELPGCERIPASVDLFVRRCLEKDPAARFQDMDAFLSELRTLTDDLLTIDAEVRADATSFPVLLGLRSTMGGSQGGPGSSSDRMKPSALPAPAPSMAAPNPLAASAVTQAPGSGSYPRPSLLPEAAPGDGFSTGITGVTDPLAFAQAQQPRSSLSAGFLGAIVTILVALAAGLAWLALRPPAAAEVAIAPPPVAPTETISPTDAANKALATYLDEAESLHRSKKFGPALDLIEQAQKVKATDPQLNIRLVHLKEAIERDAALTLARRSLANGDPTGAREKAKEILERDPENAEALAILEEAAKTLDANKPREPEPRLPSRDKGNKKGSAKKETTGRLALVSDPPAVLYVDDRPNGLTPVEIELSSGQHIVELRKDGYEPMVKVVDIAANRELSVSYTLVKRATERRISSAELRDLDEKPTTTAPVADAKPQPAKQPEAEKAPVTVAQKAPEPEKPPEKPPEPKASAEPAAPRLPARHVVRSVQELTQVFGIIEGEIVKRGEVPASVAKNVTVPLAETLISQFSPGKSFDLFPRNTYYLVVKRAREGAGTSQIAVELKAAHLRGDLD